MSQNADVGREISEGAGAHTAGQKKRWIAWFIVGYIVVGFIVGGVAIILGQWWIWWLGVGIVVSGALGGWGADIMGDSTARVEVEEDAGRAAMRGH